MSSPEKSAEVHVQQTSNLAGESTSKWKVNGKLLPLKMYYFFFYGASGSFIPFITVHLKHLRLSASEAGLITGLSMLFAMLLRALIAMLADKLSARKAALLACCLGFGLSFFSMWFVPRRILPVETSTISSNYSSGVHQHQIDQVAPWICWARDGREICRYPASLNYCPCRIAESHILTNVSASHRFGTLQTHTKDIKASDILRDQEASISENYIDSPQSDLSSKVNNQKHYADTVVYEFDDKLTPCFYTDCEDELISTSGANSERLENATMLQLKVQNVHASTGPAEDLDYRNSTFKGFKPDHSTAICLLNCTQMSDTSFRGENSGPETLNVTEMTRSHCGSCQKITPDLAFSLSFVLLITGKSLYSASTSLIDAVTYTILGPYSLKWGQQRLWGTIGTGVTVLSITVVNDSRQVESFSGLFIACIGLSVLAFLIGLFKLRADKTPKNKMFLVDLRKLLSIGAVRLFLVKLLFFGIMAGTAQNFIFWFLVDLGSGQITLGVCLLLYCVASVIILRCSRIVLHKLGQVKVMHLTLVAYAIRYLVLSFLTNPWMALPVEVLHGVTYSLFWAAASSTASMVAPPGTQASSQGLAGAMYWDLGRGMGIVLAGQLLQLFGARWTFRAYSLLCVSVLPVLWILDRAWPLKKTQDENRDDSKEKDEEVGEELLKQTLANGFYLNNNEDKSGASSKDGLVDVTETHGGSEKDRLSCREVQISESASVMAQPGDEEVIRTQETRVDVDTLHSTENTAAPENSYNTHILFSKDVYSSEQLSINQYINDSIKCDSKLSEYETCDIGDTGNACISVQILETNGKPEQQTDISENH
ncbi:hypothetical protein BsWGS_17835 [Bradybaena similaris]